MSVIIQKSALADLTTLERSGSWFKGIEVQYLFFSSGIPGHGSVHSTYHFYKENPQISPGIKIYKYIDSKKEAGLF